MVCCLQALIEEHLDLQISGSGVQAEAYRRLIPRWAGGPRTPSEDIAARNALILALSPTPLRSASELSITPRRANGEGNALATRLAGGNAAAGGVHAIAPLPIQSPSHARVPEWPIANDFGADKSTVGKVIVDSSGSKDVVSRFVTIVDGLCRCVDHLARAEGWGSGWSDVDYCTRCASMNIGS